MQGGAAPAQVVVVHRREVVVDQGVSVNQLQRAGGMVECVVQFGPGTDGPGCRIQQAGTDALAAGFQGIAHRGLKASEAGRLPGLCAEAAVGQQTGFTARTASRHELREGVAHSPSCASAPGS